MWFAAPTLVHLELPDEISRCGSPGSVDKARLRHSENEAGVCPQRGRRSGVETASDLAEIKPIPVAPDSDGQTGTVDARRQGGGVEKDADHPPDQETKSRDGPHDGRCDRPFAGTERPRSGLPPDMCAVS